MNLDVEESTYSTLCNPLLDALKSDEGLASEQFQNGVSEYRNFVKSLELQHEAHVADMKDTTAQIAAVEAELAVAQAEFDQLGKVVDGLKSDVDAQKNITSLAKTKFVTPVELEVDGRRVSVSLNKTIAQLEEDHQFQEQQLRELEDELAQETAELDRRIAASSELQEMVIEMRDKLLSGKGDASHEARASDEEDLLGSGSLGSSSNKYEDSNTDPDSMQDVHEHTPDAQVASEPADGRDSAQVHQD